MKKPISMKNLPFIILLLIIISFWSCTDTLDKKVGTVDASEIEQLLSDIDTLKQQKINYIKDAINQNNYPETTYRRLISDLSIQFDSIEAVVLQQVDVNNKLKEMIYDIKDIYGVCLQDCYYNGNVSFKNPFDKDIKYLMTEFKYSDEYDRGFEGTAKITDEPNQYYPKRLKADFSVGSSGDYELSLGGGSGNGGLWQAVFKKDKMYQELKKDNFSIKVNKVVFTDKSKVESKEINWEYIKK